MRAVARSLAPLERALIVDDAVANTLPVAVKLSPLVLRILTEAARRMQYTPSEIVEELLRMHGPAMIAAAA